MCRNPSSTPDGQSEIKYGTVRIRIGAVTSRHVEIQQVRNQVAYVLLHKLLVVLWNVMH